MEAFLIILFLIKEKGKNHGNLMAHQQQVRMQKGLNQQIFPQGHEIYAE